MKPVVVIVGRPNVGKSTLFNRITRKKDAIVDDLPGVTRDRHYGDASWNDVEFTLVDTGGFIEKDGDAFSGEIRFQVEYAVQEADAVIIVLDGKEGISPYDTDLIDLLRKVSAPVFYTVNKIDSFEKEENLHDFYSLGIEDLYPVSGEHGYGIPDFLDDLVSGMPVTSETCSDSMIKLAVVGRPNVGKSSLINRVLGEKRLIVSDVPGTTRDSIDSICDINGKTYLLVDTAGIRRKKKVKEKLEKFSIIKALRTLDRCDVALILLDAEQGIAEQDIKIAGYAHERGCGCVFVLNKWDAVEKDQTTERKFHDDLRMKAKFLSFAPAVTASALTGLRVPKIFKLADEVYKQYSERLTTGQLNKIIERAVFSTEPPLHKGKRIKIYYTSQVSSQPPTFVCFSNYPSAIHFSYKRYLINKIRDEAGLDKTPLRIIFRRRTGRIEFGGKKGGKRSGGKIKTKKRKRGTKGR